MPPSYVRHRFRVAAAREEVVAALLWARGALGCEIRTEDGSEDGGTVSIEAWFGDAEVDVRALLDDDVSLLSTERIESHDWLELYRATATPFAVGRRFVVDPGDATPTSAAASDGERFLLRIPARTAFGTGSHESTRLVVACLEDLDSAVRDREVLDVGTGSGILSFAALRLGARSALGFDIDADATLVAGQNVDLNPFRAAPRFFAGTLAALGPRRFDLVLVNVLPERIHGEIPALVRRLRPGGLLISSGNLWERRDELVAPWTDAGLVLDAERRDGEWAAFLFRG